MSIKSYLCGGRIEWNSYRGKRRPEDRISISDYNFSLKDFNSFNFTNVDFASCEFQDTVFAGSDFTGSTFSNCRLSRTNFSGAKLVDCNFHSHKIKNCQFSGIVGLRLNLENCRIRGCKFKASKIKNANFTYVIAEDTEIIDCKADHLEAEGASFTRCEIRRSDLTGSKMSFVSFKNCNLSDSTISKADISDSQWLDCKANELEASNVNACRIHAVGSDFRKSTMDGLLAPGAKFRNCSLAQANLIASDLSCATIDRVKLDFALLCKCNLRDSMVSDCIVFGISCWGTDFLNCSQKNIKINPSDEYSISVSSIEYSFFLYQSLDNNRFKQFFESTSEKLVLILGRFIEESENSVELVRDAIASSGLIPVVFDFGKPEGRDLTEIVLSLALMSRFVVVDLSDPRCTPYELGVIAPQISSPIVSIIQSDQKPFAMFDGLVRKFAWVFAPMSYRDKGEIKKIITESIVPSCDEYIKRRGQFESDPATKIEGAHDPRKDRDSAWEFYESNLVSRDTKIKSRTSS